MHIFSQTIEVLDSEFFLFFQVIFKNKKMFNTLFLLWIILKLNYRYYQAQNKMDILNILKPAFSNDNIFNSIFKVLYIFYQWWAGSKNIGCPDTKRGPPATTILSLIFITNKYPTPILFKSVKHCYVPSYNEWMFVSLLQFLVWYWFKKKKKPLHFIKLEYKTQERSRTFIYLIMIFFPPSSFPLCSFSYTAYLCLVLFYFLITFYY